MERHCRSKRLAIYRAEFSTLEPNIIIASEAASDWAQKERKKVRSYKQAFPRMEPKDRAEWIRNKCTS